MNEKQLAKWLMDLAACYDYIPQKAAIPRYLRILRRWRLSSEQWEELADRTVMRLTRKFLFFTDLNASILRREIGHSEQLSGSVALSPIST